MIKKVKKEAKETIAMIYTIPDSKCDPVVGGVKCYKVHYWIN